MLVLILALAMVAVPIVAATRLLAADTIVAPEASAGALASLPDAATDPGSRERLTDALAAGRAAHGAAVLRIGEAPSAREVRPDWVLAGEVCGLLGQLLHDLEAAAAARPRARG